MSKFILNIKDSNLLVGVDSNYLTITILPPVADL